jgi:hypothetical protein
MRAPWCWQGGPSGKPRTDWSERLARAPELIGKRLRIYYDADDIRVLQAFLADDLAFARPASFCAAGSSS